MAMKKQDGNVAARFFFAPTFGNCLFLPGTRWSFLSCWNNPLGELLGTKEPAKNFGQIYGNKISSLQPF